MKRARAESPPASRAAALNAALAARSLGALFAARGGAGALHAPAGSPEAALDAEAAAAPTSAIGAAASHALVVARAITPHARAGARAGGDFVARHAPFADPLEHGSRGFGRFVTGATFGAGGAMEAVEERLSITDFSARCAANATLLSRNVKHCLLRDAPAAAAALRALQAALAERVMPAVHRARGEREKAAARAAASLEDLARDLQRRGADAEPLWPLLKVAEHVSARAGLALGHWGGSLAGGTFGRFFSKDDVFAAAAAALRPLVDADTVFVDFSAGTNAFGHALGLRRWVGFDIFPPPDACPAHFRLKNWLAVEALPGSPADAREALVGFNPPFGPSGRMASRFIEKTFALPVPPRLVALITPPATPALLLVVAETNAWLARLKAAAPPAGALPPLPRLRDVYAPAGGAPPPAAGSRAAARAAARSPALAAHPPPEWVVVHYDVTLCAGQAFFLPGSVEEKTGADVGIRNEEPPVFAVLSRGDAIVSPADAVSVPGAREPDGWWVPTWRVAAGGRSARMG